MRKRSAFIQLGLTTAVALSIRCGGPRREAQRCVDSNGVVVEDRYCQQPGSPVVPYPYRWYYGGSGFYRGERAIGGATIPTPGVSPVRTSSPDFASSVSRGGFGATGEGGEAGE